MALKEARASAARLASDRKGRQGMSDEELQDPQQWEFERAEKRRGVKRSRAVVSVAFSREDYERVVDAAQRHRIRTSEFIRNAALEHARDTSDARTVPLSVDPVSTKAAWTCTPDPQEDVASSWASSTLEPV
jgi:hypothetical protein